MRWKHLAAGLLIAALVLTASVYLLLKTRDSVKALMEQLNGTVAIVMGKGRLSKYLDWLAQDLTRKVIPFWGEHEKAGVIDCGAVQFDIRDGLAKSRGFVLNTPVSD